MHDDLIEHDGTPTPIFTAQWSCLSCRRIYGWAFTRCAYDPVVTPVQPGDDVKALLHPEVFPDIF